MRLFFINFIIFFSAESTTKLAKITTITALTTIFITYVYFAYPNNEDSYHQMFYKKSIGNFIDNKIIIPNIIGVFFIFLWFSFLIFCIIYKYDNKISRMKTHLYEISKIINYSLLRDDFIDKMKKTIRIKKYNFLFRYNIIKILYIFLIFIFIITTYIITTYIIKIQKICHQLKKIHDECLHKTINNILYENTLYDSTFYSIEAILSLNKDDKVAKKYNNIVNYSYDENILCIFLSNMNYIFLFFLKQFYFSIYDNIIKYVLYLLYKPLIIISLDLSLNKPNLESIPKIIQILLRNTNIDKNLKDNEVFKKFTNNVDQFYKNIEFVVINDNKELRKIIEIFYQITEKNETRSNVPISFIDTESNNLDIHEINKAFKNLK